MNPNLARLQLYPFEKLRRLLKGAAPPELLSHISLSIGEPQHPSPPLVTEALERALGELSHYPGTRGTAEIREAMADWLIQRYRLPPETIDPEVHLLPVNGTREALFAIAQCVVESSTDAKVLLPNPFYQIYEGATLLAGAEPVYLDVRDDNPLLPDFDSVDSATWSDCQLLYLCTPSNPTGAVLKQSDFKQLLELADRYNFVIASDECYSEIYFDKALPPMGLLEAAARLGRTDYHRCLVFQSLSKRSNLPGLRSGFVAGDARLIEQFLLYRTYHGSAMPLQVQSASAVAWADEEHVVANRRLYQEKFATALEILQPAVEVDQPEAGFFLWLKTPIDEQSFTRQLFEAQHLTVIPGTYLSRPTLRGDPGANRVRVALVANLAECREAAERIKRFYTSL